MFGNRFEVLRSLSRSPSHSPSPDDTQYASSSPGAVDTADPPLQSPRDAQKGDLPSRATEPLHSSSSHTQSIANDLSYPPDVRQNPATDHKRDALDPDSHAVPPVYAGNEAEAPASRHQRNAPSTADFAYAPNDPARLGNPPPSNHASSSRLVDLGPEHQRQHSFDRNFTMPGSSNQENERIQASTSTSAAGHQRYSSTQTTLADSSRTSSITSSHLPVYAWAQQLKHVVASARPGVNVHIDVHVAGLPSQGDIVYHIGNEPVQAQRRIARSHDLPRTHRPLSLLVWRWILNEVHLFFEPLRRVGYSLVALARSLLDILGVVAGCFLLVAVVYVTACVVANVLESIYPMAPSAYRSPSVTMYADPARNPFVSSEPPICPMPTPQKMWFTWQRFFGTVGMCVFMAGLILLSVEHDLDKMERQRIENQHAHQNSATATRPIASDPQAPTELPAQIPRLDERYIPESRDTAHSTATEVQAQEGATRSRGNGKEKEKPVVQEEQIAEEDENSEELTEEEQASRELAEIEAMEEARGRASRR